MKLHIITVGKPKLAYAKAGFEEYLGRLQRLHTVRVTHVADKYADDAAKFRAVTTGTYVVALEVRGTDPGSHALAAFLKARGLEAREVSFVIGGPDGLPPAVLAAADFQWSLSRLTLPHDLAMLVTLEALYRASMLNAGLPYHH